MGGAVRHPARSGRDVHRSVGLGGTVPISRTRTGVVLGRLGDQHGDNAGVGQHPDDPTVTPNSGFRTEPSRLGRDRPCRWHRFQLVGIEMVTTAPTTPKYGPASYI